MKTWKKAYLGITIVSITALSWVLAQNPKEEPMNHEHMMMMKPSITKAIAVLRPTKGNTVTGMVTFTKTDKGIRVVADIQNLTPGQHGFHIHEYGDCSSDDGSSAGGHFNPTNMPHGSPTADKRHIGDMGNITADSTGHASLDYVDEHLTLEGDNSILGRGIIVHAKADDLMTQPTGNAGGRVACGVIGVAKN